MKRIHEFFFVSDETEFIETIPFYGMLLLGPTVIGVLSFAVYL